MRIPAVLLTAADDPIIDVASYRDVNESELVTLQIEEHGGHLGFMAAEPTPFGTRRSMDYALHEYLAALTF